jgi:putative endonuclease
MRDIKADPEQSRGKINRSQSIFMWYVYILKCKDSSLYTGSTTDISRRLSEHNSGKGGNYARMRYPVKLLLTEPYQSRSIAQKREAQIKRWTKDKKLAFVLRFFSEL